MQFSGAFALDGHYFAYEPTGNILNPKEQNSEMLAFLREPSLIMYALHI